MSDQSFETLVSENYRPVYRFAVCLTGSETEACDLTQRAFYAWASQSREATDAAKVRRWLLGMVHRSFLESGRAYHQPPDTVTLSMDSEAPVLAKEACSRLDPARIVSAMSRVDPSYRGPVALYYLEDCAPSEMGEIFDWPIGAVKTRLAVGLAELRRSFARAGIEDPKRGGRA